MIPEQFDSTQASTSAEDQSGPGVLRGQVWLTIQTRQAQQLVRGRNGTPEKPAITGLVGFANQLRVIWQAARNDDPYADWWLIKVHETLDRTRQLIKKRQTEVDTALDQMTSMDIVIAESSRPYRVPLRFANPYAYRGARLIADYDALVRTVLTGTHIGLFDREISDGFLKLCTRKIRGAFALPQDYRFLGIDREAVRKGTGKAAQAVKCMGVVPEDIMSGELRAPLVPRNVQFPKESADHIGLTPISKSESTQLETINEDG
ncbi:MAG: PFL_4669 family integrating conjugative element protein [Candidatus Sedimenticola sp. 6PFRAG1]